MTSRRKTRELALCCCYEIEVGKHEVESVLDRVIEENALSAPARAFLSQAVTLVSRFKREIDKIIQRFAVGWKLHRIARVDLCILRLAIAEILLGFEDPPPSDAIIVNEAVVLAKKFSTKDSGKFVNGILASVVKEKETLSQAFKPPFPS